MIWGIFIGLCALYQIWRHGDDMHALGRKLGHLEGRHEAELEQLARVPQAQQAATRAARAHLRVVK